MGKLTKGWRKVRKGLHLTSKNKAFSWWKKNFHYSVGNSSASDVANYAQILNGSSGLSDANAYYYNMKRTINSLV